MSLEAFTLIACMIRHLIKGWKREELGVIFGLLANEPTTVVICVLLVNEILVAIFVLLSELLWVTFVLSNVSYKNSLSLPILTMKIRNDHIFLIYFQF